MKKGPALRRGEHRPCASLRETVCAMTRKITDLNRERERLASLELDLRSNLQHLGWSIRQLDGLSRIPDTGAAVDEIERNRRRNAFLRNLNNAFRLGRRPRIAADVTIEGIRTIARTEVEKLRKKERDMAEDYYAVSQRLQEIPHEIREAERLMSTVRKRADQERCDPDYVSHFCG